MLRKTLQNGAFCEEGEVVFQSLFAFPTGDMLEHSVVEPRSRTPRRGTTERADLRVVVE
jgi:hypothetical protein